MLGRLSVKPAGDFMSMTVFPILGFLSFFDSLGGLVCKLIGDLISDSDLESLFVL